MAKSVKWIVASAIGAFASIAHAEDAGDPAKSKPVDAAPASGAKETAPVFTPIVNAAAVYATYQDDVTEAKSKPFKSTGQIEDTLTSLGGQNPGQLTEGWLAYSALVAAQSPEYRDAVRDIESFYGRDRVLTGMRNDLRYARTLEGGDEAIGAALRAVDADSERLSVAAAFVKEQAYTLQSAGWAKARIGDSSAIANDLFARSKTGTPARSSALDLMTSPELSSALSVAGGAGAPSMWENISKAGGAVRVPGFVSNAVASSQAPSVRYGKERTADRIATLAAFHAMGVGSEETAQLQTALADRETKSCLNMAQLNLQQCVAAAHQHHELPFCISQHALDEIGQCIGEVAQ